MSRAVLSRFTDADDEVQPNDGNPLAGVRIIPDHERKLEFVARERAVLAWGRLREISVLDSSQATDILTEAILDAVAASKKPMLEEYKHWGQVRAAARKLRECVLRLWGEPSPHHDPSRGSTKLCRICRGSKNLHDKDCMVGKALALASAARLGEDE